MNKIKFDTAVSESKELVPDNSVTRQQREAIATKLVRENPDDNTDNYQPTANMNKALLHKVAGVVANNIKDNRTIMELVPDTKAIFTLMISTMKSPNTLIGSTMRFEDIEKPAGIEWEGNPNEILSDWLFNSYNFDSKLTEILWNCLCWKGSHPIMVLPETAIDTLINGKPTLAGEDFKSDTTLNKALPYTVDGCITQDTVTNIGIIKDSAIPKCELTEFSTLTEAFEIAISDNITFTDNIDVLKRPMLVAELARRKVNSVTDTHRKSTHEKVNSVLAKDEALLHKSDIFKPRRYKENGLLTVRNTKPEDRALGDGLIIDLPSESVIPISDLVTIVLLDGMGNPISLDSYTSEYDSVRGGIDFGKETGLGGGLIKSVRETNNGRSGSLSGNFTVQQLNHDYGKIFDRVIIDVLTGSDIIGDRDSFTLPDMKQIHLMGMMRALKGMRTTIMVVPSDLITYFHHEKNELGIGISMLTANKFLASQRITIRLANQLARITNSVPRKEVIMHIDEDEKEPAQVAEMMKTACIDDMQSEYSIGLIDSRDIVENFVRANTSIRADHKHLPTHHMEVKDFVRSVGEVDSKLEEELRGDWCKALDTQPELVDDFFKPEFAVEHITKNTMYTKTIIEKQHKFEPQINQHIKQLCYSYSALYRLLKNGIKIKKNGGYTDEQVLEYIIESFKIKFPRPEQAEIETTYKGFTEVSMFIKGAIESIIDEDMAYRIMDNEIVNSDAVKALRVQLEMLCKREWLQTGTVTIIKRLLQAGDEGEANIDISALLAEHNKAVITNLGDMAKDIIKRSLETDAELTEVRDELLKEIQRLKDEKAAAEQAASNPPADDLEDDEVTPPEDTEVDETTPPEDDTMPPEDGVEEPEDDPDLWGGFDEETPPEEESEEDIPPVE